MRTLIMICLLLAGGAALQGQTTIVLQPGPEDGKDAMVWDDPLYNKAIRNYADHKEMLVHAWTDQGVPVYARSYIAFDFAEIHRSDLQSATLVLSNNPDGTFDGKHQPWSGPNRAWVRRVITPWDEHTISWNNQPAYTDLNRVLLPASTDGHQTYRIDVTELLRDMLYRFPDRSHGFAIILEEEAHYRALVFATSDYDVPELRPKLELQFAAATPIDETPQAETVQLEIYPNPSQGQADVRAVLPAGQDGHMELLNVVGQALQSWRVHSGAVVHVPLRGLAAGQYWLRLGTDSDVKISPLIVH